MIWRRLGRSLRSSVCRSLLLEQQFLTADVHQRQDEDTKRYSIGSTTTDEETRQMGAADKRASEGSGGANRLSEWSTVQVHESILASIHTRMACKPQTRTTTRDLYLLIVLQEPPSRFGHLLAAKDALSKKHAQRSSGLDRYHHANTIAQAFSDK